MSRFGRNPHHVYRHDRFRGVVGRRTGCQGATARTAREPRRAAPLVAPESDPTQDAEARPAAARKPKSVLDDDLFNDDSGDLFKDLSDDLFEGLEKPKPKAGQPKAGDGKKPEYEPLDQSFDGEDLGQEKNRLLGLAKQMRQVEEWIAESKADRRTQKAQSQIIDDLAKLIEEAKRRQSQSSQSSGSKQQQTVKSGKVKQPGGKAQQGKPGQAASRQPRNSDDSLRNGEVLPPDLASRGDLMKQSWGNLPQRVRDAIANASDGKFLPKYEILIEQYFQTLAEKYQKQR